MNILSSNGKKIINYNNVVALKICASNSQWSIIAIHSGGSYITLETFYTEPECQNVFDRLCDKIATCREHDTIDLGDLWY